MRISRKQMFMGMAELAAKRSTCFRGNVGCVIVDDNNPVSIGYNGPPSGAAHCLGNDCNTKPDGGCVRAIHAERNALMRLPFALDLIHGLDMYVTSNPCPDCAEYIVGFNVITNVYYQSPYRIKTGIATLLDAEINVFRFSPSGYLVNEKTGEVLEAN